MERVSRSEKIADGARLAQIRRSRNKPFGNSANVAEKAQMQLLNEFRFGAGTHTRALFVGSTTTLAECVLHPRRKVLLGFVCVTLACASIVALWVARDAGMMFAMIGAAFFFGAGAYAAFFRPENWTVFESSMLRNQRPAQQYWRVIAVVVAIGILIGVLARW
ncbi:hypothetical protein [Vitreimonas flagellata]|uniref:hypothetical protein n=1 Tax=Vitreimonas flagellata TaxID=2560861 RepID=UPI001075239F|nr:hypothetical protein [Vitreimonas flagellata]